MDRSNLDEPQWTEFGATLRWIEVARVDDAFRVRNANTGDVYRADSWEDVHEIARDLSQLADYYGAGDVIAQLTERIGVHSCSKCKKRHAWLNGLLPRVFRRATH